MKVKLRKANDKKHKYVVEIGSKTIKFGAYGYSDFTIHKDEERKKRYIARHKVNGFTDKYSRNFWARWLLWNKPTIKESKKNITERFGIVFL